MLLSEIEDLPIFEEIQEKIEIIESLRQSLIELLDDAVCEVESLDPDDLEPDDIYFEDLDDDEEFDMDKHLEKVVEDIEEYKGWIEGYTFDSLMI